MSRRHAMGTATAATASWRWLSEGGYGAVNIALHHLGTFGGLQSWSGCYRNSPAFSPVLTGYSERVRELRTFAAELRRAGAHVGARIYPGGHDWGLWPWQAAHMLRLVSHWTIGGSWPSSQVAFTKR